MADEQSDFKYWETWSDVPDDVKTQLFKGPFQKGAQIDSTLTFYEALKKIVAALCLLACFALPLRAQTTATVSGDLIDQSGTATSSHISVDVELATTGSQRCYVAGTGTLVNEKNTYTAAEITAGISLVKNSSITCGSTTGGSRWKFTFKNTSSSSASAARVCTLNITGATNLDNAACLNASATPVTAQPTDSVFAKLDGTNAGFTGDLTLNGHNITGIGSISAGSVNNRVMADQYASLSAAITALGGQGVVELPCGPSGAQKTYTVSSTITVSSDGVQIVGHGLCSNLSITTTSDAFAVTGALFQLRDMNVTIGTATSRNGSAIVHATNATGSQGLIQNVRFVGNASSTDNGMILYEDQPDTGLWIGRDWRIIGGVKWQAFIKLKSAGTDTIASNYFYTLAGSAGCTEACISLDGAIDTVLMFGLDIEPNVTGSGPDLWLKNTPAAAISPRGVICTGCALSNSSASSTGPAVQLDNSRHFQMIGGEISGPSDGIDVNTNAIETIIDGVQFLNVGQHGIKDSSTAAGFSHYDHNTFVDVCGATNNTYDAIQIANSVFDRTVIGNSVRLFANTNKCAHGINIVGGSGSGISVIANDIVNSAVTTRITDGDSTGSNTILSNPGVANSIAANNTSMNAGLGIAGTGVGTGTTVYALELSGTSSSTGGAQIFTGQLAVNANERFRVEPSDGTIRASSFQINALSGGLLTGATNASISSAGVIKGTAFNATNLLISATAPTISSGFGTSPSIATNNGTAAFTVNVGTGGTATSGVIGLPTATNGWNCFCTDITTNSSTVFACKQTASSTSSATIGNFNTSAAAAAWVASDILSVSCFAR